MASVLLPAVNVCINSSMSFALGVWCACWILRLISSGFFFFTANKDDRFWKNKHVIVIKICLAWYKEKKLNSNNSVSVLWGWISFSFNLPDCHCSFYAVSFEKWLVSEIDTDLLYRGLHLHPNQAKALNWNWRTSTQEVHHKAVVFYDKWLIMFKGNILCLPRGH